MDDKLKLFLSDVVKLNDLSASCADILLVFAGVEAEIIEYNKELKIELLTATGMWGNSLQNKLKELKDKGLLLNPNRGMYQLHSSLKQATDAIKQGEEVYIRIKYIETESTITKQIAYVQEESDADAMATTTSTTESITATTRRPGRAGTTKPTNFDEEIAPKIISGETKITQYARQNHFSPNTVKKWVAEYEQRLQRND